MFPGVAINPNNSAVDGWSPWKEYTAFILLCWRWRSHNRVRLQNFGNTLTIPLKNIEEALSEITIESLWNWYTSTHLSRLETGCPEIHIATRWSKKDPIGRLTDPNSPAYDKDVVVIVISALDGQGNSF